VPSFQRARDSPAATDPLSRPVLVVEDDAGLRAYLVTILAKPITPEQFEAALAALP
jgi:hypothetical protein